MRALADATDSRVTVLDWKEARRAVSSTSAGSSFYRAQRLGRAAGRPERVGLAARAVRTGRTQSGFGSFQGEDIGIVAQPIGPPQEPASGWPLYSRNFEEVAETVSFIRGRVLWACAAALLIALIGGWLVARRLARRVRRVERAAATSRTADFDEPLPVDSEDELGQLTRTFNDMQQQLREVDIARKEFIATASHELRTPIFSLAGFVELLQDEDLDDETTPRVRRHHARAGRAAAEAVRRPARPVAARLRLGRAAHRAGRPRRAARARSWASSGPRSRTTARSSAWTSRRRAAAPSCDRERVAQIMRILLDNALRHTPDGHGRDRERAARQRRRRVHGGGRGAGPAARLAATRRSSASTRATPRAARASGSRSPASSRSAWTAGSCSTTGRAAPPSSSSCPRTDPSREARQSRSLVRGARARRGRLRRLRRRRRARAARSTTREVTTTRVEVVEGIGREGGFDPGEIYSRLSPGVVTVISLFDGADERARGRRRGRPGLGLRARRRGLHRHQRPRGHRRGRQLRRRPSSVFVQFSDGNRVPAEIVGHDPNADVALLKVEPEGLDLTPLRLGRSAGLQVGEPVAAIGSPFGEEQSLSVGVVSALDRNIESLTRFGIGDAIQTDAAINPGNSGGPLLDAQRPRDRHQRADQVAVGRRRGGRLRDPGRRRAPLARRAARGRASRLRLPRRARRSSSGRSSPSGSASTPEAGALVQGSSPTARRGRGPRRRRRHDRLPGPARHPDRTAT